MNLEEKKNKKKILFLGKQDDPHGGRALTFLKNNFIDVHEYFGKWGDPMPEGISRWKGDYIISYLSRWVIPENIIDKAKIATINFHPGSPDFPGIGCNNFALYYEAAFYGVTCHHMSKNVDTGRIIATKKFPIFNSDNVKTLLSRTYDFQLVLFYEIMQYLIQNKPLPLSKEIWKRSPYTREEFNKLSVLTLDMDETEVKRRIRATKFLDFNPYVELNGFQFEYSGK